MRGARVWMWGIRLAALALGGGVGTVAIAALVTTLPTFSRTSQASGLVSSVDTRHAPETVPAGRTNQVPFVALSESSRYPVDPSALPSVYPLRPALSRSESLLGRLPAGDGETGELGKGALGEGGKAIASVTTTKPSVVDRESASANVLADSSANTDTNSNALPLTLQDVVILALENNRDIKNAYLDRIIQQEALRVAEDRFNPDVTPRLTVSARRNDQGLSTSNEGDIDLGTNVDVLLPTGTRLEAGWSMFGDARNTVGLNQGSTDGLRQQVSVEVTHPLWRNSGEAVTRAPLQIARLEEDQNIFGLETTLISTITRASQVYFSLVLAQQQLDIEKAGLVRTEAELDRIEALIAVGRLAAIQRIEAEADVANRQVAVLDAENSLRSAQLNLIQALDIDQDISPVATEINALSEERIRFAEDDALVEYALANNPDYRSQLIGLDVADLQLLQAEDQLGWDLDLVVGYRNDLSSRAAEQSEARASLQLSRELGDRSLKQQVIAQRTRIAQLENDRTETLENLEISVRDAIRDVEFQQTQVEQAQRATRLAEQQLDFTQTQFRQGSETFLGVVQAQDSLVAAQNQELSAQIGYQNALLRLDQELGHTLETWNIQIRPIERSEEDGAW